jgi:hypothetical protein
MQPVHGTGIIEFGLLTDPAATVTRSITYTNDGPDSIELDLTTSLQRPDANFGWPHTVYEPPPGLLSVPDTVSVPAGESRTIDIVLDLALSPEASVFGDVVATSADGTTQVRTTLTWTRSAPLHRLEVDFFDRRGDQPQEGLVFGILTDLDTGQDRFLSYFQGRAWFADAVGVYSDRPLLPEHRYSLITFQGEAAPHPLEEYVGAYTGSAHPDIRLESDTKLSIDAREGKPFSISTDRPSVRTSEPLLELSREAERVDGTVGRSWMAAPLADPDFGLFVIPGTKPRDGTMLTRILEHREAAPAVLTVGGQRFTVRQPIGAQQFTTFPEQAQWLLHDAGDGAPEDLVDADGKLVVITETGEFADVGDVARAAAGAGAAGVIATVRGDGPARRSMGLDHAVPVGVVTREQGDLLREQIAAGRTTAKVTGAFPSPYTYDLVHELEGAVGGRSVRVDDDDLGVRKASYHRSPGGD